MTLGKLIVPLAFMMFSGAALAQQAPLTADEFDALTQGRTITYSQNGVPYGTEEYRPGRTVVWAFTDSECREGNWFPQDDMICFDYHDGTPLQCWTFFSTAEGLVARFEDDDVTTPLTALGDSDAPLNCPSTGAGV